MTDQSQAADWIAPCPACSDADNECGAIYDHGPDGVRLECDCGCCGPWGLTMDEARDEWNRLANMAIQLRAAAEALKSAHAVLVHDARDWSLSSRDAWLYGLLVGWPDDCMDEILAQHPRWKLEGIDRLKRLRRAIAAIYDTDRKVQATSQES